MIVAKTSPLVLISRFFPVVAVEAMADFDPSIEETPYKDHPVDVQQNCEWNEEQKSWSVNVAVVCWPDKTSRIPYRYKLQAFGTFAVQDGIVPKLEIERFVACNACGVLYSAIRDMLRTVTAYGPYAQIELPLAFFTQAAEKAESPE